ncbi:cysteine-rich venom protein DIS2-like [Amphiura filiformis]|uniref:cysteine-rich venom protein DIS2-like n=1 Tax=Amphiura filiformis TaxID=82378 RepID=UPI003B228BD5
MFALIMDIKALIFLFEIIFVYCQPGQDDDLDMPSSIVSRGIGYTDFSDDEAEAIVERHNFHRSNTRESASNMKYMTWDNDLATMAQKWADTCVYEHGGKKGSYNTSPYSYVGQNLAIGTTSSSNSGVYVTDAWHAEEEDFTYDTNTCRPPPKKCGHYTQIVWAGSQAVGCGRKFCSTIYEEGIPKMTNGYYIVCNYGEGGNMAINGIKQKPFKTGERCSDCPSDAAFCSDKSLCRDCTKASDLASCGECNRRCENCGTLDSATCTCQCAPGWDGPTCSDACADHHEWCGANPGWYGPALCNGTPYSESVQKYCLKMCGICKSEDPNFVCGRDGGGGGGGRMKRRRWQW